MRNGRIRIRAHPQNLRVAISKIAVFAAEFGNFRRADKGEVFRPCEQHKPFAFIAFIRDIFKSRAEISRDSRFQFEFRQFFSNTKHYILLIRVGYCRISSYIFKLTWLTQ